MRVFVTGASGFIGGAVVPELLGAGHEVLALARSDASAEALVAAGAQVRRGSLEDLAGLRAAAAESDGVIHLAFIHDFSRFEHSTQVDRRAIEALCGALEGSDRPLVIASGLLGVAPGRVATERDWPEAGGSGTGSRQDSARLALDYAPRGVRISVLRLPPSVHGEGDHGFVPALIEIARSAGVSGYVGDGSHRWPAVHRSDAARLFRLALEQAPGGSVLHAVGDEGVPVGEIAGVIGRHLGVPTTPVAPEEAGERFGWLGHFFGVDSPAAAQATRELLGWEPAGPGLLEDLEAGHYFRTQAA
ncbi:SDR family oxidoreductase [Streptomyces hoynatensis]|uniref:SDR family oxidoreductase n=1 Tax=Streptomyces hoynatensis TaxID=1141874 RepID=A0A3A9YPH3_9ACTN|nr:SDR family oxidoreductase [Streptomyces hoynatensis]RKN37905.1 SDR family oxidoreductase [Streptomyces hoynatensis]